ncbi:MAG: DUF2269 family protein [Actinomycetota bacterium]
MSAYSLLKLVHIVSAIVAVGANVSYFVWFSRVKGEPQPEQVFALRGIKTLDSWLANPAYVVLPVTGITMVLIEDLGFTTFWIGLAIGLYVFMGAFAGIFFAPALRRQIDMVQREGPQSAGYADAARRTTVTGALTMVPIAVILYLMVIKPTL